MQATLKTAVARIRPLIYLLRFCYNQAVHNAVVVSTLEAVFLSSDSALSRDLVCLHDASTAIV